MILPLFFVIFQNVHQHHDRGGQSIFEAQITQSGLATPVLMLTFLSVFMLPLVASLVAGDIVANEDGNGTLKTILTRSVDRGQVLAAKTLAAFTYGAVAVFLSATVATVAGIISFGFHHVVSLSGTVVSAGEALPLDSRLQRHLPDPAGGRGERRGAALGGHPQQRRRRRGHDRRA